MLSPEELKFLDYWEKNRDKQKKLSRQFFLGIPLGLLFILPMVISLSSHWDKRADLLTGNPAAFNPWVLLTAFLLIAGFVAILSKRLAWERREQEYQELKARQIRETGGK